MTASSPSSTVTDAVAAGMCGVRLRLRVTPKAKAAGIGGWRRDGAGEERLRIAVTAPPDKGKANRAVIALLARTLGCAKSDITLVAGDTGRNKTLEIAGERVETLRRKLDAATG